MFETITERREEFALVLSTEMGKPMEEARGEVRYGAEFLRWFSGEAVRVHGRYSVAPDGASRHLVHRKPVGPCLLITPWNFPLAMITRKVGPALAAGCTVVLKPSELTPLSALLTAEVFQAAGLPPGVLNVITTTKAASVVTPLLRSHRLRKISFTGSTEVGRRLLADSAGTVLRTSMELGGDAPFLVFEDADIEAAVDGAMIAKMRNMGEACTAANRFLVHEKVAEEFAAALAMRMGALTVGPAADEGSEVGPLIDARSRDKVHGLVTDALDRGARLVTGGGPLPGPGHFYAPTVLCGIPADARLMTEEIFGPVAPILTFRDEREAIRLANATPYGLAAYAYTRDLGRVTRLTEELETGMLAINSGLLSDAAAPFGGVKQSGLGREGGAEGIAEYLETTYVRLPGPVS
ncbi:succinate semialdehyde dehydrogenase [Actinocorallia herbida]|uniref:Succinate semialdehyde dehydrogenase n=1 Tax=Actinocorallia herbida TaxID=58109 RepID=A0A3N1D2W7_9ACTN|nr:succinate semialdehyde dehydrogenase [Actinocorallia herbida]